MTNNQNKDTNDIDVVKMAEKYFVSKGIHPTDSIQVGERFIKYADLAADFAQFYHREKMRKMIEKMKVKKVDHYNASGDFGINERDGYHLAICDLSDLTKTE